MDTDASDRGNPSDFLSESSGEDIVESDGDDTTSWCICQEGGSVCGDMVECCNTTCPIKWFYLHCMKLATAPKGDWYCSSQCTKVVDTKDGKARVVTRKPIRSEAVESRASVDQLLTCAQLAKTALSEWVSNRLAREIVFWIPMRVTGNPSDFLSESSGGENVDSSGDSMFPRCGNSKLPKPSKVSTGPQLGKRERHASDKPPPVRKSKPNIKVGDYVGLHESKLDKYHIPCHVVQTFGDRCLLYCRKGVLRTGYAKSRLVALSGDLSIFVENWRTAAKISLREVASDPASLEVCYCDLAKPELTKEPIVLPSDEESTADNTWLSTPLYTLSMDKEEVLSPDSWLLDTVNRAAQLLILQEFPHVGGLQDPSTHQCLSFQVLRGEFVQIIHVGGSHWVTVSNIGCNDGEVCVYDSLYYSVPSSTLKLIASLMFSPTKKLVVRLMDVGTQANGSDCGVHAIVFAYDICSGNGPCKVRYDHWSIRRHLADCLEKCHLSRFPVVGERRTVGVRHTQSVDLHCSCRMPKEVGNEN